MSKKKFENYCRESVREQEKEQYEELGYVEGAHDNAKWNALRDLNEESFEKAIHLY